MGGAALLLAVLGAWGAPASGGDSLRARIPFGFGAGDKEFPSGDCSIDMSMSNKVSIRCSRVRTVVGAFSLPFTGDVLKATQTKEIIFNRYGDTYFLSRVWIAHRGRELVKSEAEKALESSGVEGTPIKLKVK